MTDDLDFEEKLLVRQYLMQMRALLEIAEDYFDGETKDVEMKLIQKILRDQNELFNRLSLKNLLL